MRIRRRLFAILFFLVFIVILICAASSSGQNQGPEQELEAVSELKNGTTLLGENNTELLEEIDNFIHVSESIYSLIVALDINNTEHVDKINMDLLVDEFSKLLVKLSEFQGDDVEKIRKDAESVLNGINSTLYAKIDEMHDKKEELEMEQLEIKKEYANLSIELALLENYTKVLEDKRKLEEKLNTSGVALKEDTSIYFTVFFIFGAVSGLVFCLKLRKREEFLKLFTRAKETRPLLFVMIVSIILVAFALYIGFKYDTFWFL